MRDYDCVKMSCITYFVENHKIMMSQICDRETKLILLEQMYTSEMTEGLVINLYFYLQAFY